MILHLVKRVAFLGVMGIQATDYLAAKFGWDFGLDIPGACRGHHQHKEQNPKHAGSQSYNRTLSVRGHG